MTGGQNGNPGARAAQPGLGNRYAEAAGILKVTQAEGRAKRSGLYEIHPEGGGGHMTRLQILYLRRFHGLTEAQAQALAALVWGAGT